MIHSSVTRTQDHRDWLRIQGPLGGTLPCVGTSCLSTLVAKRRSGFIDEAHEARRAGGCRSRTVVLDFFLLFGSRVENRQDLRCLSIRLMRPWLDLWDRVREG